MEWVEGENGTTYMIHGTPPGLSNRSNEIAKTCRVEPDYCSSWPGLPSAEFKHCTLPPLVRRSSKRGIPSAVIFACATVSVADEEE